MGVFMSVSWSSLHVWLVGGGGAVDWNSLPQLPILSKKHFMSVCVCSLSLSFSFFVHFIVIIWTLSQSSTTPSALLFNWVFIFSHFNNIILHFPPCSLLTPHNCCLLPHICGSSRLLTCQRPSGPFLFSFVLCLSLFSSLAISNVRLRAHTQTHHSHTMMLQVILSACDQERMLPSAIVFVHSAEPFEI